MIHQLKTTTSLTVLGLGLAMATATAGHAQDDDGMFALEEIVVTAQKREQSQQDVPVAISTIASNDIEAMGWDSPVDIASQIPNVQYSAPVDDAMPIFNVRGISMVDYTPTQSSPIGIYADEVYLGATFTHGLSMFDMQRVEVLRGPQGTLYGKNTTGGAINLISRTPQIDDETNGYASFGYGRFNEITLDAAAETTLIEGKLAARAAFTLTKNDGHIENLNGGKNFGSKDNVAGRVIFNFQPSDAFKAILKLQTGESTPRATPPRGVGRIPQMGGGFGNLLGQTAPDEQGVHASSSMHSGRSEAKMDLVSLNMTYALDNFDIISVSSWSESSLYNEQDTDGHSGDLVHFEWSANNESISQDLRLQSNFDGKVNFILGGYYGKEDVDSLINTYIFGALPFPATQHFGRAARTVDVEKKSLAVYTSVDAELSEKLSLNVGLRYTSDENTRDRFAMRHESADGTWIGNWAPTNGPFANAGIPQPFAPCSVLQVLSPMAYGGFCNPDSPAFSALFHPAFQHPDPATPGNWGGVVYTDDRSGSSTDLAPVEQVTENEFTGKISLDYQVSDNAMVYASYSRGFRAGSFNGGVVYFPVPLDQGAYARPEFVNAYEIGFKSEMMDRRVRLNGAFFNYDYTDQQFVNQVGISATIENAPKARIRGAEFELLAALTEELRFQAGMGYLDTEYKEAALADLGAPAGSPLVDLAGNQLQMAPEFSFNFAFDYEKEVSENLLAKLHFNGNYQTKQWFSAYNDFQSPSNPLVDYGTIKQDSYWVFNGRLTLASSDERYAASFYVNNIFDQAFDVYAISLTAGLGYDYFMEAPPRTWGVKLTTRF